MSPVTSEQARGARVDHRSDIWAFGAVLFELLTGRRAFAGDTVSDTIANVLTSTPDVAAVPEPFRRLVSRCLERDLRKRLGWMGEARTILAEYPVKAPPVARRSVLSVAAGGVAGIAAGALGATWLASASRPAATVGRFRRLTTDSWAVAPAISPDGKLVAYYASRANTRKFDLWVQQVGGGSVRLVEGQPFGLPPAFSADGSNVYFYAIRNIDGVYQVPALGGEATLVIPGNQIGNFAPSPDGKWLAYTVADRLVVRAVTGGTTRTLASGLVSFKSGLLWSHDSKQLLTGSGAGTLLAVDLDATNRRSETAFRANLVRRGFTDMNVLRLLSWLPDDQIVFSAALGEAVNIWKLPYARLGDGEPAPLTQGAWRNQMGAMAGNRLVFANTRLVSQVWAVPADWKTGRATGELSRVTPEFVEAQFPDVRRDGKSLVYVSIRNGRQGVDSMDLVTGKERQITSSTEQIPAAYSTFSPDGTQIAFGRRGKGWPAYITSATGGDARHVGNPGGRIRGWSRDGKFLLIWLIEDRKAAAIGVLDTATGAATEILSAGETPLDAPRLSPDGSRIVFLSQETDGPMMWIAPFRGAAVIPRSDWVRVAAGAMPTWAPDGRSLIHLTIGSGDVARLALTRQPLDVAGKPSGPPSEFYNLDGLLLTNPVLNTMCVSRDRLFLVLDGGASDIWTVDLSK